jgi:hypothetical protein
MLGSYKVGKPLKSWFIVPRANLYRFNRSSTSNSSLEKYRSLKQWEPAVLINLLSYLLPRLIASKPPTLCTKSAKQPLPACKKSEKEYG